MSGQLKIALLGKPEISCDEQLLTIEHISLKGQALLIYLAVTGKSSSRSTLAALLWSEMPEETAKANLRLVLTQLRRWIAPHLVADRQSIAFDFDQPYWLDIAEFEANVCVPGKAKDVEVQNALALYRGDFLADFYVPDAPLFEEWTRVEQERLRQMASHAYACLAEDARQRADFSEGILFTRKRLQLEPWSEESYQQLMWLLAAGGQRSAALAHYEICRRVLAEELAVEPAPATTQLYQQIRDGAFAQPELVPARGPVARRAKSNLPAQLTPLVGRESEIDQISLLLRNPQCRLLTLVGPGGIGKTRLAIAAAEEQQENFGDGVTFVSLVGVQPAGLAQAADLLINTVANAITYDFSAQRPPRELLLNHLAGKEMLLLLDNFEQLLPAAELLLEMVKTAPGLKLLITSRARLGVEAEWIFDVEGLAYDAEAYRFAENHQQENEFEQSRAANHQAENARAGASAPLTVTPAVRLFEQVARRTKAGFSLAAEQADIERICYLVAGLPLAIELAANWVRSLSCKEIVWRLEGSRDTTPSQGLDMLVTTTPIVAERHQNMRIVLAYSWDLLSKEEQTLFRRLSIFRDGFEMEAAEAVTDATFALMAALVDKSWLRREVDGRFRIHELLRQFGSEQLALDSSEQHSVQQRHCRYYANFLASRSAQLQEASNRLTLTELDREVENIAALWEELMIQAELDVISSYLEGLWLYYESKGWFQEGVIVISQACALDHVPALQKVRWTRWLGEAHYQMGHMEQSRQHFQQAMELLGRPLPTSTRGWNNLLLGQLLAQLRRRIVPIRPVAQSQEERLALLEGARVLSRLGQVYFFGEEKTQALVAGVYELNLCEQAGAASEVARSYATTTLMLSNIPLHRLAAYYGARCEQTLGNVDQVAYKAYVLEVMGVYKMGIGDWSDATKHLEGSAELLARVGLHRWWEETLLLQALVAYHQGYFRQSAPRFVEALHSARRRSDPLAEFWAILGSVECSLRLGDSDTGDLLLRLDEAKALPEKYLGRAEMIRYHGVLALVYLEQDEAEKGWREVQEAARLIQASPVWMFWSFEGYAAPAEFCLSLWEKSFAGESRIVEAKTLAHAAKEGCKALHNFARVHAPGQPRAWLHQGRYYRLSGDSTNALRCWNKALALAEKLSMPYEQSRAHTEIGNHLPANDPDRQSHLRRAAELALALAIKASTPA